MPATTITIAGNIRLSDGQAASGAEVRGVHFEINGHEYTSTVLALTRADEAGRYHLQVGSAKLKFLMYSHPGSLDFRISAGELQSSPTGSVVRDVTLPAATTVSGRVIDDSGCPVAGVKLLAIMVFDRNTTSPSFSFSDQTVSNADGSFLFRKAPPGPLKLQVLSEEYPVVNTEVTAPAENVLVQLPKTLSVEGHAILLGTQQPVSSVTVMLMPYHAGETTRSFARMRDCVTDSTGAFRMGGAAPGHYRLIIASNLTSYQIVEEVPVDVRQTSVTGIRLLLHDGAWLMGKTIDSITRKPVEGVKVGLYSGYSPSAKTEDPSVVSGKDGAYCLRLPQTSLGGGVSICATKYGYGMRGGIEQTGSIDGKPYRHEYLNVRLDSATTATLRDIEMEPLAGIAGKVVGADAMPIAVAHVELTQARPSSQASNDTSADGKFTLDVRPFTQARIKASREGYGTTFTRELSVGDKVLSGVEIALAPEGIMSGTVKDPDGNPMEGARVHVSIMLATENQDRWGSSVGLQSCETKPTGSFVLKGLPACRILLYASHDKFMNSETTQVQVRAGEEIAGIVLVLEKRHFLAGTIRNPKGRKLEGIVVYVSGQAGGEESQTVKTDRDGHYRAEGLPAGPLQVYVGPQNLERDRHHGITADTEKR